MNNVLTNPGGPESYVRAVLDPPKVPVMQAASPPNMGPNTIRLVQETQPNGHFALLSDGSLALIVNGNTIDSYQSINIPAITDELKKEFPIVVYGLGSGQLATKIRSISEEVRGGIAAHVLVYEPDPGVLSRFLAAGLPMQGISVACDMDDFREMFHHMLQGRSSVSVFHNAFTIHLHGKVAFDTFIEEIKRISAAEQVTMNTINVRMSEWVHHASINLNKVVGAKPAMALTGAFEGLPCFIVGAGPSLDTNGHLLKECAKKGLLITIDVAGRAVDAYGAEPHIFVTVEAGDLSLHMRDISWIDRVAKAFSLEANPSAFDLGKGGGLLLPWADSNYVFNEINSGILHQEGLPIGGSVTTAAFLLAEAFGCSQITLIGQDLSNTGRRRASKHVFGDKLGKQVDHGSVQRWGTDDRYFNIRSNCHYWDMVTDTPQWLHARVWFQNRAAWLKKNKPGIKLINATEGGSHITGYEDMTLQSVLDGLPDVHIDIESKLENVQPIWGDSVKWWRSKQVDTLRPIYDAAMTMCLACSKLAELVNSKAHQTAMDAAMLARNSAEVAFRSVAQYQVMFTGFIQLELRTLNEIRYDAARKSVEGALAAEFFESESDVFRTMALKATTLMELIDI